MSKTAHPLMALIHNDEHHGQHRKMEALSRVSDSFWRVFANVGWEAFYQLAPHMPPQSRYRVALRALLAQYFSICNRKSVLFAMLHRHLNHQRLTLAAIDDVISRGQWRDWADLRRAVLADRALLDKVERVCRPYASDPYAQRHHFWMHYAKEHRPAA